MNKTRKFWETCRANYAHLKYNRELTPDTGRVLSFHVEFIDEFDFNNKTIVDYGCGGGHLGLYLFQYCNIEKYIGVDIAERSLISTRKLLKDNDYNFKTHLVPVDFMSLKADMLISIACMQHFPNVKYLKLFLKNINNSNIKDVVLNIRYANETISNGAYDDVEATFKKIKETRAVCNFFGVACLTNKEYIGSKLTNYILVKKTGDDIKNKGQYLTYRMKDNK